MPTQRKLQVIVKEIDLGTSKHNVVMKNLYHVTFDFSVVLMYLLHKIQHDPTEKMKTREREVFGQLKHSKTTILSLKNKFKEIEKKGKTWQDDRK